jgi:replicative DNA helicase
MGYLELLNDEIEEIPPPNGGNSNGYGRATFNELMSTIVAGLPEGQRNQGFAKLAGLLRSRGLDRSMIEGILFSVNISTKSNLPANEVTSIARSISRYAPKPENREPESAHILTVDDLHAAWKREQELHPKPIDFGYPTLTTTAKRFLPGEVLTLAGRSGTGKTSIIIHLARAVADSLGGKALFVSLEMNASGVYHRLSTISKGSNEWSEVVNTDLLSKVKERFNSILTVDRDSLTLQQVEQYLTISKEIFSEVPVVAIDYLGYLRDTANGSQYEKVSRVARDIKSFAKRTETRVILACQTSRAGEDGNMPVQLHHLRDSGAIEESADMILGIWGDTLDVNRRHCSLLKNRHGMQNVKFDLDSVNLDFKEIPVVESEVKKKRYNGYTPKD